MPARVVLSFDDAIVTEVELSKPVTVVGRHPACDIVIDHPAVSGRHMLFRIVDRTVYAEDLASTNGTKVNGLVTGHHVVHHLDMIEVGRHKIHFFEDALLAGKVGNLETTVLTDYERTMMAAHVAQSPRASAPSRDDPDLSRTMAIPRDPAVRFAPGQETVSTRADAFIRAFALKAIAGERAGETIALDRPNTMIGTVGGDTALIVKRGQAFFIARLSGQRAPRLNHRTLGPGTHAIAAGDVIDVGGSTFEVVFAT
jgi:predicted component of type VI protein secretion system